MAASQNAALSADNLPVGHILKGSYEIQKYLGEGGAGAVYLADHIHLGHQVAIKTLFGKYVRDASMKQRFVEEGIIQANLNHRNIVRVSDIIDEQGICAIIMEFVEGASLDQFLKKRKVIDVRASCELFLQILEGVAHAHSKGVVHRDIKPANILMQHEEKGVTVPKLTDFGIAKITAGNRHTETGTAMGTIYYAPPEQLTDAKSVDHRADVYALGCTFFELLSGQVPFGGDSMYAIMRQHIEAARPDICHVNQEVPPEISLVLKQSMAVDPAGRFQSVEEFRDALAEAMLFLPESDVSMANPRASSTSSTPRVTGLGSGRTYLPGDPLVDAGFIPGTSDHRSVGTTRSGVTASGGRTRPEVAVGGRTQNGRTSTTRVAAESADAPDKRSLLVVNIVIVVLAVAVFTGLFLAVRGKSEPVVVENVEPPTGELATPNPTENAAVVPAAEGSAVVAVVAAVTAPPATQAPREIAQACREMVTRFSSFVPTPELPVGDAINHVENERNRCVGAYRELNDGSLLETLESDLELLRLDLVLSDLRTLRARTTGVDSCLFVEDSVNRIVNQLWSVHGAANDGSLYDWQVSQIMPQRSELQQRYLRISAQHPNCTVQQLPEELAPAGYHPPAPPVPDEPIAPAEGSSPPF
jgi:serine/threonine protein kinase